MKLRQRIAGSRCGTTVPGAKTKQETTRENDLGRIGNDEVNFTPVAVPEHLQKLLAPLHGRACDALV